MTSPEAAEFLVRFAQVGHASGYSTAELEQRVESLAASLGVVHVEVFVTPTAVEIAFGPLVHQEVHTLRVRPARVDLDAISQLDDLVRVVLDERLGGEAALAALVPIKPGHSTQPWPIAVGSFAGVAFAMTPMLGGGWREALAAGLVGVVVGCLVVLSRQRDSVEPIAPPLAAMAASFSAAGLVASGIAASSDLVTLAALVPLLPGLTLTVGVRELASKELQSGVANTANALVQLLGLVFGVEIGRSVAAAWFGQAHAVASHPAGAGAQALAAVLAGLAFTGTLRARLRDAPLVCSATLLALVANALGTDLVGRQAGIFGAALCVGIAGRLVSARLRRSELVFTVPGVLMLVPGSIGYASAIQLLTNHAVSGVTAAFEMFVTAVAIAYGLMIAAIVLPPRLTQARARRSAGGELATVQPERETLAP
jgi:uncharacterized membrane protein YjjP (DUF1212 family)